MMKKVVVVSAARTAVGKYGGQWTPISEAQLGAEAIKGAIARAGIEPAEVEDILMGNVAGIRGNIARMAGFLAGCPEETTAYNMDRQCGSGSQAIANAAMAIECGMGDIFVAGGMELMSLTPHQLHRITRAYDPVPPKFVTRYYAPVHMYEPLVMPQTADKLAKMHGVTREECDAFSLQSHQRAAKAIKSGVFKDEIVPVEIKTKKGSVIVDTDECVRYDATPESMAKLPVLYAGGVTTAGNSCPRSDGAGALVLMSEETAKAKGLEILAYVRGFAAGGCDPTIMGYGPVPACNKLFKMTGLTMKDIDLIELNEAFAGQSIPCIRDLNMDMERVNPNGGAIALGHPLGGTGAVLATKLLYEMKKKDYQWGIVTMCCGGGQGMVVLYERK